MSLLKKPTFWLFLFAVLVFMIGGRLLFKVPLPHIQIATETLRMLGPIPFTNTMLALAIVEVVLLLLAFLAARRMELVPSGLQNFFEAIVEFWQNQSIELTGAKATRAWLPLVLTLFLVIWFANYSHFVPGFDSIGIVCEPGHCPGEEGLTAEELPQHTHFDMAWLGGEGHGLGLVKWRSAEGPSGYLQRLLPGAAEAAERAADPGTEGAAAHGAAVGGTEGGAAGDVGESGAATSEGAHKEYALIPLLRVPTSDLNMTLALAIIAFVAIEIAGFRANGVGYLTKFLHIDFSEGLFQGFLNIFVGIIELVSELSRIISYAFRLFGNIFAGQVLLFVFPFLFPFLLALPIYGLELFVGLIQAFVFSILTLAFISLAIAPPHGDAHH